MHVPLFFKTSYTDVDVLNSCRLEYEANVDIQMKPDIKVCNACWVIWTGYFAAYLLQLEAYDLAVLVSEVLSILT